MWADKARIHFIYFFFFFVFFFSSSHLSSLPTVHSKTLGRMNQFGTFWESTPKYVSGVMWKGFYVRHRSTHYTHTHTSQNGTNRCTIDQRSQFVYVIMLCIRIRMVSSHWSHLEDVICIVLYYVLCADHPFYILNLLSIIWQRIPIRCFFSFVFLFFKVGCHTVWCGYWHLWCAYAHTYTHTHTYREQFYGNDWVVVVLSLCLGKNNKRNSIHLQWYNEQKCLSICWI